MTEVIKLGPPRRQRCHQRKPGVYHLLTDLPVQTGREWATVVLSPQFTAALGHRPLIPLSECSLLRLDPAQVLNRHLLVSESGMDS